MWVCECMFTCSQEAEVGIRSSGARVTSGCELPNMAAGNQTSLNLWAVSLTLDFHCHCYHCYYFGGTEIRVINMLSLNCTCSSWFIICDLSFDWFRLCRVILKLDKDNDDYFTFTVLFFNYLFLSYVHGYQVP